MKSICIPMTHSDTCPTRKKTKNTLKGKIPNPSRKLAPTLCPHEYFGGMFSKKSRKHQKPIHHCECIDQPLALRPPRSYLRQVFRRQLQHQLARTRGQGRQDTSRVWGVRETGRVVPRWALANQIGDLEAYFLGWKSIKIPRKVEILNATHVIRWWFWAIISIPYPY